MTRVKIHDDEKKEIADLEEAKGVHDQGQPIEWQPMGQRNILVWKMLMRVVWQSTDDDIADGSMDLIRFWQFGYDSVLFI